MNTYNRDYEHALASHNPEKEPVEGEWECTMCGYVREGRKPPATCPDCGADADEFEFYEFGDDEDWDDEDFD